MSFWIKTILEQSYPQANWEEGVDVNDDGVIQDSEKLQDADQDGLKGSPKDWEKYYHDNRQALNNRAAFFKTADQSSLSVDNPIFNVLSLESEIVPNEKVQKVVQAVHDILKQVQWHIEKQSGTLKIVQSKVKRYTQNPEAWKVLLIYTVMKDQFEFGDSQFLLADDVSAGVVNCDTSGHLARAVAHELNLPLSMVVVPGHAFLRWSGEGQAFNIDQGDFYTDDYYQRRYPFEQSQIGKDAHYLKNLNEDHVRANTLINRAIMKNRAGDFEGALQDYDLAEEFLDQDIQVIYNRGYAHYLKENYNEALIDLNKAIEKQPQLAEAYRIRGNISWKQGHLKKALKDYNKSYSLDPFNAGLNLERALILLSLKKYKKALPILNFVLEQKPNDFRALSARGLVKYKSKDFEGAMQDYKRALELKPQDQSLEIPQKIQKMLSQS